ncbi:phosphoribosylanthranilate isomerase [Streptomyces monticola]|uniref:N-(5'-phosphoribosyl)anthranilate isomerase n=1 Tax=Streptomyces monticola TaxID=2666263 RepID=A0ABW2JVI9_9ACTN
MRTAEDVDTAVRHGADAVGFVFADSPRQVSAETARDLVRRVPDHVVTVGVFRNQDVTAVRDCARTAGLGAIQLHGDEGPEQYAALRSETRTLIRSLAFPAQQPLRHGEFGEDLVLVDAPVPGSGRAWDWDTAGFAPPSGRWLLAGGLTPDNVAEAVRVLTPWGVDVSSGVESRRGVKSPALIEAFIKAAAALGRVLAGPARPARLPRPPEAAAR